MKALILTFLLQLLHTYPAAGASGPASTLDRAGNLLETGKPDSAAVLLYDMVNTKEEKNDRVRALYYLAKSMEQLGRLDEKMNYLKMAYEAGREAGFADKVRFLYAQMLLETGSLDDCIDITGEFRGNYTDSPLLPDILYIAGNAHLLKGEYQRAFNIFNEISKNHKQSQAAAESIMKEGVCLYHLDFISGAIEQFEQYLAEVPEGKNTEDVLYYSGLSYERSRQLLLAAEKFNRLILRCTSYPDIMDIYFRLGKNYFATNMFAESENSFENYIFNTDVTNINRDEALYYLERIKFKTGKYYSVADIGENFITQSPGSSLTPKIIFDLAMYYRAMGKTGDAVEKYLILLNNPLYSAYADTSAFLIADTYASIDEKDKAHTFLRQTAHEAGNPERVQKMFMKLGSLAEGWELYDAAIAWYDSSLAVDSSPELSFQALYGIGRTFKTLNRWYEASRTFERIINEYPDHPEKIEIYMALGDIYYLQGQLNDAISVTEKAIKLADESGKTDILLRLAELHEGVDEDRALHLYSLIYNDSRNSSELRTQALLQFGKLSFNKGDNESALNAYAKVINGDADSISVLKATRGISGIHESMNDSLKTLPRE